MILVGGGAHVCPQSVSLRVFKIRSHLDTFMELRSECCVHQCVPPFSRVW